MFKHILIPTDGSQLSTKTIKEGIIFAKSIGAKVTGLCVVSPQQYQSFFGIETPREAIEHVTKISKKAAQNYLNVIEINAGGSGVPCEIICMINDRPYIAIIRVAEQRGCDLIMMASHGRSVVKALLIGSETQNVLAHSTTPVLLCR